MSAPFVQPPDPERLFFVVGTGRCGSTLLQAMLSCHPSLYVPPELRYFGRHEPAAGFSDPLLDEHLEPYLARCRRDVWWQDTGLDVAAFEQAVRGGVRTSRDVYLWVLGHVAARRGNRKPRCGEKTPYYALHVERIAELFPGARFIHLYRDPRDVAASFLEQYWVPGGTALRVANYLVHVFGTLERAAARLGPGRLLDVRYEDLVDQPERELRRVCDFLGEDYDPAMLDYTRREDSGYLEVEEDWKGLTRLELTRGRMGRYRERLSRRQLFTLEHRLGSQLPRLGYAPTRRGPAPIHWLALLWTERLYLAARRRLGAGRSLLDEHSVLARRNTLAAAARRADGAAGTR